MLTKQGYAINSLVKEDYEGCFLLLDKHLSFGLVDLQSYTKRQQDSVCFTAHKEGVLVGCIEGTFVNPLKDVDDELKDRFNLTDTLGTFYISHLVTHPDYRNRGVGSVLLRELLKATKTHAKDYLALGWVKNGNAWDAGDMFYKAGFKTLYISEDYYKGEGYYCDVCSGLCECGIELVTRENTC